MKDTLKKGFLGIVLSTMTVLFLVAQVAYGASLNITWDANTESDLAGYYIYYGTSSGNYGTPEDAGDVTEYELTGLDEGVRYYVAITVYDTADNESEMSDEESGVPPDTQDPMVTITNPTASSSYGTSSSTIILGGSASDNVGVSQVSWVNSRGGSGTALGTSSWSASRISLQEGDNVITVTAQDPAGNTGSDSITVTYTPPDTQDPTATITNPTSSSTYDTSSSTITLGGSAWDNVGVTQVSWVNSRGGSGTASGTTSWSASGISLQSGDNVITVTAQDAAGNTGSDSITVTYTPPDTQDPTATITTPTSSSTYDTSSSTITLGGSASDNVGVTQVSWVNSRGGSGTASGTTSWSASGISLQSGDNVITVTARDAAGNTGSDSITVTYTPPDTQDPTVTITTPTSSSTYDTSSSTITLGGSASDNVDVTQVSWVNSRGGSGTASGTSSWSASGISLQSGDNVITVTAQDAAGHTASDTITVTYTPPDTQDPTVTITTPTSSSTYDTSSSTITLGGSASDNVDVTQVSWVNSRGGSGTASGTSSWSASGISLQSGDNVITVTAQDAAGNTGSDSITVTYTPPDTQDPTITITTPTSSTSYDTSSSTITLGGSASDNVGVTQVSWVNSRGGSGIASGTTSWSASGISLQSGANSLTVTARDEAGNTRSDSITVTYTPPDTQDPTATITTPTSSTSYDTSSSTITLGGSASDNVGVTQVSWVNNRGGSGTASGTSSWSASGISLQSGNNVITVTARDAANNTGSDSITVTYTPPDTQNPSVTITIPTPSPGYASTDSEITLGGSSSDNVGVTEVRWINNRGGSGTASGTIMWSTDPVPLACGEDNIITITAEDEAGNMGTDTLTVNVGPCKPGGLVVR